MRIYESILLLAHNILLCLKTKNKRERDRERENAKKITVLLMQKRQGLSLNL